MPLSFYAANAGYQLQDTLMDSQDKWDLDAHAGQEKLAWSLDQRILLSAEHS